MNLTPAEQAVLARYDANIDREFHPPRSTGRRRTRSDTPAQQRRRQRALERYYRKRDTDAPKV